MRWKTKQPSQVNVITKKTKQRKRKGNRLEIVEQNNNFDDQTPGKSVRAGISSVRREGGGGSNGEDGFSSNRSIFRAMMAANRTESY